MSPTHGRHGEPHPSRVRQQRRLGVQTGRWYGPRGSGPVPAPGVVAACSGRIRLRIPGTDAGLLTALAWLEAPREAQATQETPPQTPPHGGRAQAGRTEARAPHWASAHRGVHRGSGPGVQTRGSSAGGGTGPNISVAERSLPLLHLVEMLYQPRT